MKILGGMRNNNLRKILDGIKEIVNIKSRNRVH